MFQFHKFNPTEPNSAITSQSSVKTNEKEITFNLFSKKTTLSKRHEHIIIMKCRTENVYETISILTRKKMKFVSKMN